MTGAEAALIITAIGTLIVSSGTAIATIIGAIMLSRNSKKLDDVHAATNGMTQELREVSRQAGLKQGRVEGRDTERTDVKEHKS